jgi:hypothetical protein
MRHLLTNLPVLRYRRRGWEFHDRTWRAQAVDDDYYVREEYRGDTDADDTGSEDGDADSKDDDGAAYSEDNVDNIY